jgi:hypothetical protein
MEKAKERLESSGFSEDRGKARHKSRAKRK